MASLRARVFATTADAIATSTIRQVRNPTGSVVNLFGSCVAVTDTIALFLNTTEIMAAGLLNVSAAALGRIQVQEDQLVFNSVVGIGDLRLPCVVGTSLDFLLSVEPIL